MSPLLPHTPASEPGTCATMGGPHNPVVAPFIDSESDGVSVRTLRRNPPQVGQAPVAFYNEIDPFAAAWLRELIAAGHIAPGVVDERDIRDIRPDELAGYTQCHFFAGIGVWSYALRNAGWPDDRQVWTASLPCQPWSDAGAKAGFDDERHLWPTFNALRLAHRPVVAFGEQVASKIGLAWLDAVQTDVEASGDTFGAIDLCAAGVGAPHIRQRSYWMAYSAHDSEYRAGKAGARRGDEHPNGCSIGGMDDAPSTRHARSLANPEGKARHKARLRLLNDRRTANVVANAPGEGLGGLDSVPADEQAVALGLFPAGPSGSVVDQARAARPTDGFWRNADWLGCRDGRFRPVESGTFPLADGAPARVGRLRGYGNAINAEVATAFIEAALDVIGANPPHHEANETANIHGLAFSGAEHVFHSTEMHDV